MDERPATATLLRATCNVLNLVSPGRWFYDNQDPYRAAVCVALRVLVDERLTQTREPRVLKGDRIDSPHAVTTQNIATTHGVADDRAARARTTVSCARWWR